ncbi:MAG: MFS transporter [Thermoplasmata archaeon]
MEKKEKEDISPEKMSIGRKVSIVEGAFYGISESCGMKYITPFALALGASNFIVGIISSLPQFLGNLVQLHTLTVLGKNITRKAICTIGAVLQASLHLVMIGLAYFYFRGHASSDYISLMLVVLYSFLIISGSYMVPAWTSWMKQIVPEKYGAYFGTRNRYYLLAIIIGMVFSAWVLSSADSLLYGFAIVFITAFAARMLSASLFMVQYEPPYRNGLMKGQTLGKLIKNLSKSNFGRFVKYVMLVYVATYFSSPFYYVYILKDLHFNYFQYMAVSVVFPVSQMVFMPAWGRFSDRYGTVFTLRITGLLTPFVALFWLVSAPLSKYYPNIVFYYLLCSEIFSGFAWSGFLLSASNFIYESSAPTHIPRAIANYNIITGAGNLIGSTLGGIIATQHFSFAGLTPIFLVMLISPLARMAVYALLISGIYEVREVAKFSFKEFALRLKQKRIKGIFKAFR